MGVVVWEFARTIAVADNYQVPAGIVRAMIDYFGGPQHISVT